MFQVSFRFAVATLIIVCWCCFRSIRLTVADGTVWPGSCAGLFFAAEFAGIYLGLQYTSVSKLTIFLYSTPFWVAAILPLVDRTEQLNRAQWIGLIVAFLGVVLALSDIPAKAGPDA